MTPRFLTRMPKDAEATRFWWIRHAPVPAVRDIMYGSLDLDCDCSDEPVFRGVATRLPKNAIWVTSELKRTQQTADALISAGANQRQRLHDARINEMDFGDYNGCQIVDMYNDRTDDYLGFFPVSPYEQTPNGESFSMLSCRVAEFIASMQQQYSGEDIVCVAHRGTILAALSQALQLPLTTSVSFVIDNVSLTRVWQYPTIKGNGPQCKVGEVGWLP